MTKLIQIISIDFHNSRLDQAATTLFADYSRSQIQRWIESGNLLVNGEILRAKDKIHDGDELALEPTLENRVSWEAEDITLNVHHEEQDFLVINKPPGLVMHPGAGCNNGTLANALAFHYPELIKLPRCGIVHRLDKDTSGLLVIAKTEKFRSFFVDKLQTREVYKQYEALVVGQVIGSFSIDLAIERDPRNRIKMRTTDFGRDALSHVSLVKFYNGYSHVAVEIETGRTHQIRVHLSHHKLPIIGDRLYNPRNLIARDTSKEVMPLIQQFPRQALHASKIGFASIDSGDQIEFQCSPPEDIRSLISSLATL
ncbi:RluA family pseudouridine synthase [Gammaproteobacteria bacterium]|nr:RluA family pseudouridine synthase [Gammaproteobacteria bacterium]MDA8924901.1 RluA family pseudouridine synthase [Gammaproteobacteria bacterium]MDB9701021.1 RluA family pseudouridine synthase [Gammaproteobacteria bacterium]MDC1325757.1 RluA family pseudouridine synthase [Gammaproteobacteria bacterium]MDC1475300.1 RluA family pseudouridine synthase [Gammaproteobacteria bacterium]|tara:strand:+ start:1653 stop:2588 length:936 start_codon:yes stop_codon:yes gene_type:complete